jgi:hypothetical protein
MAGKPQSYWEKKFENYINENSTNEKHEEYQKLINHGWPTDFHYFFAARILLREYSASEVKHYCCSPLSYEGGGNSWARFFAGRWGTHHGNAVHATLVDVYSFLVSREKKESAIDYLFLVLKDKLKEEKLDPDGDLYRIIAVIEQQTGKKMPQTLETLESSYKRL